MFDPRTLYPFDWELLAASLDRTKRLVVYDDANRRGGFAAEILATVAEEMPLATPPKRVTRADVPIAFAVELELAALPSRDRLRSAVLAVMKQEVSR